MAMTVRLVAHLFQNENAEEDRNEKIVIVLLLGNDKIIARGIFYGEIEEGGALYPFRYDVREAKLLFGEYSKSEDGIEEFYSINLADKIIIVGEYFTITNSENIDFLYRIDHVVDMNALAV